MQSPNCISIIHLKDQRYTIAQEYCGHLGQRWIARFCGDFLGQDQYPAGAMVICLAHADHSAAAVAAWGA